MSLTYYYQAGETRYTVTVERRGGYFRVMVGDRVVEVSSASFEAGVLHLEVEGRRVQLYVAQAGSHWYIALAGQTWLLERATGKPARSHRTGTGPALGSGELMAEMPGQVLEVLVTPGETVVAGQTLVLLEAMKMELRVTAPAAGRVHRVHCTVGQVVERGQVLIEWAAIDNSE